MRILYVVRVLDGFVGGMLLNVKNDVVVIWYGKVFLKFSLVYIGLFLFVIIVLIVLLLRGSFLLLFFCDLLVNVIWVIWRWWEMI